MMSKTQYLPFCKVYIIVFSSNQLLIRSKVFFNNVCYCYFPFRYGNNETSMHWGSNIPVLCQTEGIREIPPLTCQFPFEYKEKTYYECVYGLFRGQYYWCPTKLDYNNQPLSWGHCGENCPTSNFRNGDNGDSKVISPKFASKLNSVDSL